MMRSYYRRGLIFVQRLFATNSDPQRALPGCETAQYDPQRTGDSAAATLVSSSREHLPSGDIESRRSE